MANARSVIINLVANDRVSGALKGVGKQFDKLNGRMKEAAGPAMAAAGAAAGGAFVAGITGAIQLNSARGKLEAQLGLTKAQSKNVGAVAGKLYSQAYGESMEEVQTAISSVIQNMDGMRSASTSALQQTTARAMDTATVMDEEVGGVTRAVAQIMKTGLAKNAGEAFDILVAGTQRGANKAQDLLDTFNEYSTQFRKLGLDGKTAMGLIQQGLQGGARDADIVADSLKEFAIRAVDGSKTTVAAFQDLGLNAGTMAKRIAAGGPTATKALDLVLDKLRGIKDPIKRNEVAVGLFGTQWEDMGSALLKMDPSKAASALGQIGGAADKAGQALGGTLQSRFEAFKRSLIQDAMGALMQVVGWMQKHTTIAKTLAVVIGTLAAAYLVYTVATTAASVATGVWAAVQAVLNVALMANPIGAVVMAIALLVAGIILAWKKSETFRTVVLAVWNAIKTGVMFAINFVREHWKLLPIILLGPFGIVVTLILTYWRQIWGVIQTAWNIIRPIFMTIVNVVRTVLVGAFRFYWAYLKLVWLAVSTIIRVAWAIIQPVFNVIVAVVRGVLSVAFIVFRNTIKMVWIAIQIYIKVAWALIKGYFTLMKFYITGVLAPIFRWLYSNVVRPVWNAIRSAILAAWNFIRGVWNALRAYLGGPLSTAFRVFKTVIGVIWSGVKTAIGNAVGVIKTIFGGLKTAVNAVKNAFSTAVNGIKTIWDRLKGIAKTPVNFVIGLYNKGIVSLVNRIAGFAGIKTRLNPIGYFAKGGTLGNPAGVSPMMTNGPMAIVGEGRRQHPEYVIPTDPAHRARAQALWAKAGQDLGGGPPDRKWLAGSRALGGEGLAFAGGGSLQALGFGGIIGGFVKGLKDFAFGNVEKVAKGVLGKILGGTVPGSGTFRDMIAAIPGWLKNTVLGWIKNKVGMGGGPGMNRALKFAKSQAGKPYVWGGVGPGGYDCSGFLCRRSRT